MIITHDPWLSVNGHRKPSECLQTNVALFRLVAALCVEHNLRLMIEPHPDTLSIGNAWACDLIDAVNAELPASPVGILYDCCHYGVGQPKTYASAIDALGTRVNHIHFSDGDAQTYALHLPLGDGCLQLDEIVAALKTSNYCGTLTNDLYNYPLLEDGARRNAPKIRDLEAQLGISSARGHA
jgi:sugar phosphate isomerase/epimerase